MDVPTKHFVVTQPENVFSVTAGASPTGGNVIISDLTQQTDLRNTCSGAGTECILKAKNFYFVSNSDDSKDPITISPYQSIMLSCSGSADCTGDSTNTFSLTKTGGTSSTYTSSQTITNGATSNSFVNPTSTASGSCQVTQNNGVTTTQTPGC